VKTRISLASYGHRHPRESLTISSGRATRRPPLTAKYNENRASRPQMVTPARYNPFLSQRLARKIRYLADQWNFNGFFPLINEFFRPNNRITMEFVRAVKPGNLGHTSTPISSHALSRE
jgi:hypothetical protein